MSKSLLIIGGSVLQEPVVRAAKTLGLRVLLSDSTDNPKCADFADVVNRIDGRDWESLVAFVEREADPGEFIGAYCGSDFGLESVVRVNKAFGIGQVTPEQVLSSLDKSQSGKVLREQGIRVPKEEEYLPSSPPIPPKHFGPPWIIKPSLSSGSVGVSYVERSEEFTGALRRAFQHSGSAVVQEYVSGDLVDVSGVFADGKFFPAGLLYREVSSQSNLIPVWGYQPPILTDTEIDRAYRCLEASCRALGITWGPVKADLIFSNGQPIVIEVTPRFHGDISTSMVTPVSYGHSPVSQWFKYLLSGELPSTQSFERSTGFTGWMAVIPNTPGIVQFLGGIEVARMMEGIVDAFWTRSIGFKVEGIEDNRAVMGFIIAIGESPEKVRGHLLRARKSLIVEVIEGAK
jgi:biotin carboxylase